MKEENIKKEQSLEKGKGKKKMKEGKKTKYEVSEIELNGFILYFSYTLFHQYYFVKKVMWLIPLVGRT